MKRRGINGMKRSGQGRGKISVDEGTLASFGIYTVRRECLYHDPLTGGVHVAPCFVI